MNGPPDRTTSGFHLKRMLGNKKPYLLKFWGKNWGFVDELCDEMELIVFSEKFKLFWEK